MRLISLALREFQVVDYLDLAIPTRRCGPRRPAPELQRLTTEGLPFVIGSTTRLQRPEMH
jgi:hypothetical protein